MTTLLRSTQLKRHRADHSARCTQRGAIKLPASSRLMGSAFDRRPLPFAASPSLLTMTSPNQRPRATRSIFKAVTQAGSWATWWFACCVASLPATTFAVVTSNETVAPDDAALKTWIEGRNALSAGNLDVAKVLFKTASAQSPRDHYPWMGLADVARLRGNAKEARELMARAVALAPTQAVVVLAQAELMLQQRDFTYAEKTFKRAAELGPDQISARAGLAMAIDAQGRRAEAKAALDAVDIKAAKADKLAPLGNSYNAIDQGNRALQVFDRMLAFKINTAEVHVGRGDAYQRLNDPAMALAAYQRAGELWPKSSALEFRLGLALERMERNAEAEAAYRSAIQLDVNSAAARNNLAQLLARTGLKLDDALQNAQRAVELEPSAALYDALGMVYKARGDTVSARQAFDKAVSKAPSNAAYRQHLEMAITASTSTAKASSSGTQAAMASVPPAAAPALNKTATPAAVAATLAAAAPVAPKPGVLTTAPFVASKTTANAEPINVEAARAAVSQRMAAWLEAWKGKQVDSYLMFYASSFVPDKMKRSAWEQDRRTKLKKAGTIEVNIRAPSFEIKDGAVKVSFDQEYSSSNYKDTTRKTLDWVQEAGVWRIQRESSS